MGAESANSKSLHIMELWGKIGMALPTVLADMVGWQPTKIFLNRLSWPDLGLHSLASPTTLFCE